MITAVKKYKTLRTTWEIKEYEYYHCTHKKDNSDYRCDQRKVIASNELWKQIEKIIESIDLDPEIFDWAKTAIKRRYSEETRGREDVYENINKTLEVEEKKKNRLLQMRLGGEFDGNYEEYERLKTEIEEKIERFKIKRKELEKESVDWTELVERTFDFAKLASQTFKNGNLEKKKEIFRAIGWNWTLKDGKLNANLQDWFLPFMKIKELHLSPLQRLEPAKKSINFERSDALNDWITGWWGLVEEVRTALMNQDSIPHIPKLV